MFQQFGELRPLGPVLVILLMALLLIWTAYRKVREATHRADLALQLRYRKSSESMGNHDSKIVDAGSVD